jgi:hypothetical protein
MAHGCEPVMPFDVAEATYLSPRLSSHLSTSDLIALRAVQLEKRDDDLERMRQLIWKSRKQSAEEFTKQFEYSIREWNFEPGRLVLVRNSQIEMDLGRKWKPRYLGPLVVVKRNRNGAYQLAELDGTISKLKFAAKRIIPYHLQSAASIPIASEDILALEDTEE